MLPTGKAKMIDVMKCPQCGFSVGVDGKDDVIPDKLKNNLEYDSKIDTASLFRDCNRLFFDKNIWPYAQYVLFNVAHRLQGCEAKIHDLNEEFKSNFKCVNNLNEENQRLANKLTAANAEIMGMKTLISMHIKANGDSSFLDTALTINKHTEKRD